MAVFRPTCRVRLQLSLDEGAEAVAPTPAGKAVAGTFGGAASAAAAIAKNITKRQGLGVIKRALSVPDFAKAKKDLDTERTELQQMEIAGTGGQKYPGGVDPNRGSRDKCVVFEGLPAQATITRAPSKDADTVSVTFAFRDLPIDPRCVRACLVSIAIGAVSREDYVGGMVGGQKRADGMSIAVVEHESEQELRLWSSTRFVGYVATWKVIFDEGGDTVQLDCVDVSCVMRSQPLLGHKIDMALPIQEGVQALVNEFPTSNGLTVKLGTPIGKGEAQSVQEPTGALKPIDVMPKQLKTRKGKVAQATTKSEKQTVWDHINDVALRVGLVPIMRGFTLYLTEPRLQFRDLEGATKMVYGRNVKHLELLRKMEGITTDTIEVRCPDRSIGRVLWARYPVLNGEPRSGILGKSGSPQPVTSRASKVSPNGTGHEVVRVLTVRGVVSLSMLEQIAEATFHEVGRQEIQGSFQTDEIESWGSKLEGDLLDLYPGQPVTILVEQQPQVRDDGQAASTYQELQSLSVAGRQKYLERLGVSPENAQRLARAQEQTHMTSTFRAGFVTIRWSAEEGVSVECDFYNFVVVREDPNGAGIVTGKRPATLNEALSVRLK
jgi:hypothetical protein